MNENWNLMYKVEAKMEIKMMTTLGDISIPCMLYFNLGFTVA